MMPANFLAEILRKLGWNDGFQIPVANDENKALEAEVARLTLAKLKAKTDSENASQKFEALERHLKFVTQEAEQVQKLISAHKKQLDAENHQMNITNAEKARLINDIRETKKRAKELRETNNEKKINAKRGMEKIEKIKKETFWDEEALKAWEESLKKRDEDNSLLGKFSKEDEKKFLELEAKRASLQMEYLQRQKTVAKMVNDLTNYESVLDRTGKTVKAQLAERDSLVEQWKNTVNILHQRDNNITEVQDEVLNKMERIQREEEVLKEEENLLNIERKNNRDMEKYNEELNAQFSRHQKDLDKVIQYVLFLNSELNSIKRQVTKRANNLESERCKSKNLASEIENKSNGIENMEKRLDKLMEKYKILNAENTNIADRCKELEKLIDYEMKQHNIYLNDSDRFAQSLFKIQEKLNEHTRISNNRELEISNLATFVDSLQKTTQEWHSEVDKKKEDLYNIEFKIDQLEEKLGSIEKQKNIDLDEQVYQKIKELEKTYADLSETKNLLQDQISRIQDEMRRLTNAISTDEEKIKYLQNKLQNEKLAFEGGLKQVAAVKSEAQEKQVEENLLSLKIRQFDQIMRKEEDEIFNLQKMRVNLQQAMRERELEVKNKKELLQLQKRNLDEDRGRLKSDLKCRQIKIDQIQSRYHLVAMSLGTDEDGQTLSMTHFKLKSAQDKYFLKQRGDVLDEKIKVIEKEIVAMENTLNIVNLTNVAYRKSLSEVHDTDKEAQTMEALQKKLLDTTDQLIVLRKDLATSDQEMHDFYKEMDELKEQRQEMEKSLVELENEFDRLRNDLADKLEKVKRTNNLIKKVEKKLNSEIMAKYDRDLEVQQLMDSNKNGLQKLCLIAEQHRELKPTLHNLSKDYGIKLPDVKILATRFSEATLSSSDIANTLSSDLRSSSSVSGSISSKGSVRGSGSSSTCQCSGASGVSLASVVLSFDSKDAKKQ